MSWRQAFETWPRTTLFVLSFTDMMYWRGRRVLVVQCLLIRIIGSDENDSWKVTLVLGSSQKGITDVIEQTTCSSIIVLTLYIKPITAIERRTKNVGISRPVHSSHSPRQTTDTTTKSIRLHIQHSLFNRHSQKKHYQHSSHSSCLS